MNKQTTQHVPHINPVEHVLHALIQIEKQQGKLTPGVHVVYPAIKEDEELYKQFCRAFVPKLLDELQALIQEGTVPDLARIQMLTNLYRGIKEIDHQKRVFDANILAHQYPWVVKLIERIEGAIHKGLRTKDHAMVIQAMHEITTYIAVSNNHPVCVQLLDQGRKSITNFFRASPSPSDEQALKKELEQIGIFFFAQGQ